MVPASQSRAPSRVDRAVVGSSVLVGATWIAHILAREIGGYGPGEPVRLLLTVMLVISFALFVLAQVRGALSLDEFQRQMHLTAVAIAFPLTLVLLFAIGFLRGEGLMAGFDPRDLALVGVLSYGIGFGIAWGRYR